MNTIKRAYVARLPKPNRQTVLRNYTKPSIIQRLELSLTEGDELLGYHLNLTGS